MARGVMWRHNVTKEHVTFITFLFLKKVEDGDGTLSSGKQAGFLVLVLHYLGLARL